MHTPFYDPNKTYEENYAEGPFGAFARPQTPERSDGGQANAEPKYDFLGVKVNSLFGIAAGPLINSKFVNAALDKGFDIPIYKTVRSAVFSCHPWPNVVPIKIEGNLTLEKMKQGVIVDRNSKKVPELITNSFGVPSRDPKVWQEDVKKSVSHAGIGQVVVLSFMGTVRKNQTKEEFIEDYT